jgi:hypothetical protein
MRPFMQQDGSYYSSYMQCNTDWTNDPPSDTPTFPALPHRPDSWTRPAEAILPDRWVLAGYRGGQRIFLKAGNPIPEPLPVTLDPGGASTTTPDGFDIDPEILWTIDYQKAFSIGMAITVDTSDDVNLLQGYDRLVVVGIKSSLVPFVDGAVNTAPGNPPPDTATYLERLFDSHHYTRGLAIVPQGTPTNNLEDAPTSFPPDDPYGTNSFVVERQPPPFNRTFSYHCVDASDPDRDPDIDNLARAIGVPNGVFANVLGATELTIGPTELKEFLGGRDQDRARLMNSVLWPATWGYFLEQMMDPVFAQKLTTINNVARPYFIKYVRGRGPAPAFRVGGVPYSVLPAVSLDLWRRQGSTTEDTFEEQLIAKLRIFRESWKTAALASVPRVVPGTTPDWNKFVDILAQQASGRQIRIRNFQGPEFSANLGVLVGLAFSLVQATLGDLITELVDLIKQKDWSGARVFSLTMVSSSDVLADPLVQITGNDSSAPSVYLGTLGQCLEDPIRADNIISGPVKPLLYVLARHSILTEIQRQARLDGLWQKTDTECIGWPPPTSPETMAFFDKVHGQPFINLATEIRSTHLGDLKTSYLDDVEALSEAVEFSSTDEVERVFTETLDCASHRLDAWITAVATRRLKAMRAAQEAAHAKPVGSYLGGYAWVENLRSGQNSASSNGGFIHAPSMAQAAAAAILRSGRQSGSAEDPTKGAIDLSSERVRNARRILDEIREGQQLGAVLGYRFERAIRDKHTDITLRESYINALRKLYPLVANKSMTDNNAPTDQIAARNVVDGLLLRTAGDQIPFGQNGLPSKTGTPAEQAAVAAITTEVNALDQLADAVADLLTAESVYQIVRGNVSGAGATLDALAKGLRPPDPEIARSPRGGVGVTHRVALAFTPPATQTDPAGWAALTNTPPMRIKRALNLDHVVAALIGNVSMVKATVTSQAGTAPPQTTDVYLSTGPGGSKGLGLRPLDLVALARAATQPNQGSLLDRYLIDVAITDSSGSQGGVTQASVAYDTTATFTFPQALEVARAIGAALAGTRPLLSDDLVPPAETSAAGPTSATSPPPTIAVEASQLFNSVEEPRSALTDAMLAFGNVPPSGTARTIAQRAALRVASTFDPALYPDPLASADDIEAAATAAVANLTRRAAAADVFLNSNNSSTPDVARAALGALQAIFGADYVPTQPFSARNPTELSMSLGDRAALLPATNPPPGDQAAPLQMLEQVARVRESLGRVRRVALYTGALGNPTPTLQILQVPFFKGEGWAGPRQSSTTPPPAGRVSTLCMVPAGATLDPTQTLEGLMLDEWTELVPAATEDTGLAIHYENPGSEAPQALLVAVPAANDGKWTFAQLLATVNETLDLAHIRMLEPEDLPNGLGGTLPGIYITRHGQNAVPSAEFPLLAKDPVIIG